MELLIVKENEVYEIDEECLKKKFEKQDSMNKSITKEIREERIKASKKGAG